MRPDHTATEFAPTQPLLATPMDTPDERVQRRQISALARVTFCFAWLFGLEPFLGASTDEAAGSQFDRR